MLLRVQRDLQAGKFGQIRGVESTSVGDLVPGVLDSGSRSKRDARDLPGDDEKRGPGGYRVRSPTNSERLNRALAELGPSAFKIHILIWKWRGAPARGTLPFFTIRSLEKFCHLTRPTIRVALGDLTRRGWVERLPYNKHHKNTLYRLVPIRKVPAPSV
ncbi:hypothetical protein ES703_57491 [subsurface metagenome]